MVSQREYTKNTDSLLYIYADSAPSDGLLLARLFCARVLLECMKIENLLWNFGEVSWGCSSSVYENPDSLLILWTYVKFPDTKKDEGFACCAVFKSKIDRICKKISERLLKCLVKLFCSQKTYEFYISEPIIQDSRIHQGVYGNTENSDCRHEGCSTLKKVWNCERKNIDFLLRRELLGPLRGII